jgi:hypothetical protein
MENLNAIQGSLTITYKKEMLQAKLDTMVQPKAIPKEAPKKGFSVYA